MHVEHVAVSVLKMSHDAVIMRYKLATPKTEGLVKLDGVFV